MSEAARDVTGGRGDAHLVRADSGGGDALVAALTAEADRYARRVLLVPEDEVGPLVADAVRRTVRGRPRPDVADLVGQLHLAVRDGLWQRQTGVGGAGGGGVVRARALALAGGPLGRRALAVAALIVLLVGFGALALALVVASGSDDALSITRAVDRSDDAASVEGRVVVAASGDGVEGIAVQVVADGRTVASARTDQDGRFTVPDLRPDDYELTVTAPEGLHLIGDAAPVDLTDRSDAVVLLRLAAP